MWLTLLHVVVTKYAAYFFNESKIETDASSGLMETDVIQSLVIALVAASSFRT